MESAIFRFSTGNETVELSLQADARKIYIEPTTVCNFSCITCIRHSWQSNLKHMTEATFGKILSDLSEFPTLNTIHFGGFGEPLSHPAILKMLTACKARGYKLEMITNGSLLIAQVARHLVNIGLDWIFVSLDGPTPDCFAQIRPGADYDEVVANILLLQQIKAESGKKTPRLGIEFVATKTNFAALPDMRKIVDRLGADKFIVTNMLPYHESMKNEILYNSSADLGAFGHESVLLSLKTAPNMQLRTHRNCKFVQNKAMAITYEGNVSPCYAFMHSYCCYILGRQKDMLAFHFGNVNATSLKAIWTDPRYAQFRWIVRNSQYPSCTDCRQVDGCTMAQNNEADCWGNQPSCGDCLWSREIIACP